MNASDDGPYPKYPRLAPEKDKRRKLTPEDETEIRDLKKRGRTQKWIAEYFGVSDTTVWRVLNPELAKERNKKLYQRLKQRYEQDPELLQKKRDANNKAMQERRRVDPDMREFKQKRDQKWLKARRQRDPAFVARERQYHKDWRQKKKEDV